MKENRSVEQILSPAPPHFVGDGFRVHNFIPAQPALSMARMDPFIMLDYNSRFYFPPGAQQRGVGVHPHKGFETVTIAYQGKIAHHDSAGNHGVIGEGDVQWMTAGSGILHKEYHEKEFSKKGGWFQMVQLWVNLPAKFKKESPHYQSIVNAAMPKVPMAGDVGYVEIIAGEHNGIKGPAKTYTPIHLWNICFEEAGELILDLPKSYNTALLAISGVAAINDISLPQDYMGLMRNDGETFKLSALGPAKLLLLSGAPIQEPIAAHGPFVMNTRQELVQAFEEYQLGKFGVLED